MEPQADQREPSIERGDGSAPGPSTVEVSDDTVVAQRTRARWVCGGFAIGIVVAFVITAAQVAFSGWHVLPVRLAWNLIWSPYLGAMMAYNRCPARPKRFSLWKRPQLHTWTVMVIIAYVALLLGAGVWSQRIGAVAVRYYGKFVSSEDAAKQFRDHERQFVAEAKQRKDNAAQLRAGMIPESLPPNQKDSLRGLDRTATPEYRARRYGIMADGEASLGTTQERNAVIYRQLAEYHEKLAAKYNVARWRPWRRVEPDPPMPGTQ